MYLHRHGNFLSIGFFILVSCWLTACVNEPATNLLRYQQAKMLIDKSGSWQTPPATQAAWQPFDLQTLNSLDFDPATRVWFAFARADSQSSHLIVNTCSNLVSVFQDAQLVSRASQGASPTHKASIFLYQPIVQLPLLAQPSTLYLQTAYSIKQNYRADCRHLSLSSQTGALLHFFRVDAPELIASIIATFLGLFTLYLAVSRRQKLVIYFSAFTLTMAVLYLSNSQIIRLIFTDALNWDLLWNFAMMLAPVSFLLFFDEVLKPPFQLAKRLALFDLLVFAFMVLLYAASDDPNLSFHRRSYLQFILVEMLLIPPLVVIGIKQKQAFAHSFSLGVILIVAAAAHDVWAQLYALSRPTMLLPWSLIAFISLLLAIIAQLAFREEVAIEKEKLQLAEKRTEHLMQLAELRTVDLNRHSEELEGINQELSDKHDFLSEQAKNVAEHAGEKDVLLQQIHQIRAQTLPKILHALQQLHLGHQEDQLSTIHTEAKHIFQVFDLVASHHAMRQHMSNQRLLIFDADKKNQRFYKLALGGSQLDLTLLTRLEDFVEQLERQEYALIAVHENEGTALNLAQQRQPQASLILLSKSEAHPSLLPQQKPLHILSLQTPRSLLHKILLTHVTKLVTHDIFGIEKYLSWGSMIKERPLPLGTSREFLIEAMQTDLGTLGLPTDTIAHLSQLSQLLLDIESKNLLLRKELGETKNAKTFLRQLRYGFDASFLIVSINLNGTLIQNPDFHFRAVEAVPCIKKLVEGADIICLNSDGQSRHELLAMIHPEFKKEKTQGAAFYFFRHELSVENATHVSA